MSNISKFETNRGRSDDPSGPTFRRTRQGSEELVVRRMSLDEDQRQILLYANGQRSIEALTALVPTLEENPDILLGMESAGLLEMVDPELGEVSSKRPEPAERKADTGQASVSSATSEERSLTETKSELTADLSEMLGGDGRDAIRKVESVSDRESLKPLIAKLHELVKIYGGTKAGERFGTKYADWMR
ncbi:MAG: hypothetical protein R3323_08715 [Wenzhouxiangellaceae bacterium]|nr:hypothetical protein [Wenzhouxiangellaceae bacterium]